MTDVGLTAMPLQGLIAGMMIGLASALMLLALGRVAGISGLAARASGIAADGAPWSWAVAFVVGLPLGVALIAAVAGPVQTHFSNSPAILILVALWSALARASVTDAPAATGCLGCPDGPAARLLRQ